MTDELLEEVKKINKSIKIGIIVYVIFWTLVILMIHLIMIPAIR